MTDSTDTGAPSDAEFSAKVNALAPKLLALALGVEVGAQVLLHRDTAVAALYALLAAAGTCHVLLTQGEADAEGDGIFLAASEQMLESAKEHFQAYVLSGKAEGEGFPTFIFGAGKTQGSA